MQEYGIIIRPLITEQSVHLANVRGGYSFEVRKSANKAQVKNSIEKMYGVKVDKVRTANRQGKWRRRGKSYGKKASWKKAVVYLKADQHIDLF